MGRRKLAICGVRAPKPRGHDAPVRRLDFLSAFFGQAPGKSLASRQTQKRREAFGRPLSLTAKLDGSVQEGSRLSLRQKTQDAADHGCARHAQAEIRVQVRYPVR